MARIRLTRQLILFAGLGATLALATACSMPGAATPPKIHAENVWSRPAAAVTQSVGSDETKMQLAKATEGQASMPAPVGGNGAIFMTLVNEGGTADKVVSVRCDAAQVTELHESYQEGDVMKMKPVEGGIEVPANGRAELKPGSLHVMLIGLKKDLRPGDRLPLTVKLEKSGEMKLEAEVKQP